MNISFKNKVLVVLMASMAAAPLTGAEKMARKDLFRLQAAADSIKTAGKLRESQKDLFSILEQMEKADNWGTPRLAEDAAVWARMFRERNGLPRAAAPAPTRIPAVQQPPRPAPAVASAPTQPAPRPAPIQGASAKRMPAQPGSQQEGKLQGQQLVRAIDASLARRGVGGKKLPEFVERHVIKPLVLNLEAAVPLWHLARRVALKDSGGLSISADGSILAYSDGGEEHILTDLPIKDIGGSSMGDTVSLELSRNGQLLVAGSRYGQRRRAQLIGDSWSTNIVPEHRGRERAYVAVDDAGTMDVWAAQNSNKIHIESSNGSQEIQLEGGRSFMGELAISGDGHTIACSFSERDAGHSIRLITQNQQGWVLAETPVAVVKQYIGALKMNKAGTLIAVEVSREGLGINRELHVLELTKDGWRMSERPLIISKFYRPFEMNDSGSLILGLLVEAGNIETFRKNNDRWIRESISITAGAVNSDRVGRSIACDAKGNMIVCSYGGEVLIKYWDGSHFKGVGQPIFRAESEYVNISDIAMSADGSTIALRVGGYGWVQNDLCVLTNPVLKHKAELSIDQMEFLGDLARLGKATTIRLTPPQFDLLMPMPWPVVSAVLTAYKITFRVGEKRLQTPEGRAEQKILDGYQKALREKQAAWLKGKKFRAAWAAAEG